MGFLIGGSFVIALFICANTDIDMINGMLIGFFIIMGITVAGLIYNDKNDPQRVEERKKEEEKRKSLNEEKEKKHREEYEKQQKIKALTVELDNNNKDLKLKYKTLSKLSKTTLEKSESIGGFISLMDLIGNISSNKMDYFIDNLKKVEIIAKERETLYDEIHNIAERYNSIGNVERKNEIISELNRIVKN